MGLLEFMMLLCFGFSWPFSIAKSIRSRNTAGKSLLFMLLIEAGYLFGIANKIVNNRDWVLWVYVVLFFVVGVDVALYAVNRRRERQTGLK